MSGVVRRARPACRCRERDGRPEPGRTASRRRPGGERARERSSGRADRACPAGRRAPAEPPLAQPAGRRSRPPLIGYQAVLAKYGYTGDPDLARVVLPLASYDISAGFGLTGPLWEAQHGGQDFGAYFGDPLVAVADGTITEVADAGPTACARS